MEINKVIIINLPEDTDRLERSLKVAREITDNIEVVRAVATPINNVSGLTANPKILGHGISHCIALSKLEGVTLIVEDDVYITDYTKLKELDLPEDWTLVSLGCTINNKPELVKPTIYKTPRDTVVSVAYIIKDKNIASTIINYWLSRLEQKWPYCVFDHALYEALHNRGSYCVYPLLSLQEAGLTTLWRDGGQRNNKVVMLKSWEAYE